MISTIKLLFSKKVWRKSACMPYSQQFKEEDGKDQQEEEEDEEGEEPPSHLNIIWDEE